MSADDIDNQLSEIFRDTDAGGWASSYSSSSEEEDEVQDQAADSSEEDEVEDQAADSSEDVWEPTGQLPSFPCTNVGTHNIGPAETPIDFFNLLFNTTFMTILVNSINTHAIQVLLESPHEHSRISSWKDTNIEELYVFLGLLFHMGHIKLNRINDYWKTDVLYDLPFKNFMSRDRFLLILRNLSFSDPNLTFATTDPNKFTKPIIDFFNNTMKMLVVPPKNLTIDESVVLWRGRLKIRQFIQGKRHKYGVKLYILTDPKGMTQKIHMYCGSHDVLLRGKGHADKVVMMLMEDYLNAGHSLYMDNFYNSVSLAENLLANKTYLTGTLRANRSRNPEITRAKLPKNQVQSRYNSRGVCVSNYRDKRTVLMISTEHDADFINYTNKRGQTVAKPRVVHEYNKYMKGVDRKDQMLSYYACYNKSTRWYKKIITHVMQVMMLNAFMMYSNSQANSNCSFYDFRINVVRKLLNADRQTNRQTVTSRRTGDFIHWPLHLPKNAKGVTKRKDCRYCLEKLKLRKAATFFCTDCNKKPGLHLDCFKDYHGYR
ncbi:piggyBac transposable element-derived protein 4-like [Ostrinia furnacalis]|uniref:piggyBac transposable element-derived protein 4-like n=1 Tax=Ostrinia furnacalis TaxID=93504 RepID=UPI0010393B94|nr:piggyBac transposable element-derived protein 4-like [Ostrinia furnacalis]